MGCDFESVLFLCPFQSYRRAIRYSKDPSVGISSEGFSLIEMMLVMAIIGILIAIAVPVYSSYKEKARACAAVQAIGVIQRRITVYYAEVSNYPSTLADIGMDDMRDPWGNPYQYLKIAGSTAGNSGGGKAASAKDGGTNNLGGGSGGGGNTAQPRKDRNLVPINTDYDLYSMGPDGISVAPLTAKASRDDIVRAADGAFVGRACDY